MRVWDKMRSSELTVTNVPLIEVGHWSLTGSYLVHNDGQINKGNLNDHQKPTTNWWLWTTLYCQSLNLSSRCFNLALTSQRNTNSPPETKYYLWKFVNINVLSLGLSSYLAVLEMKWYSAGHLIICWRHEIWWYEEIMNGLALADLHYDIISHNQAHTNPSRNLSHHWKDPNQSGLENPH